MTVTDNTTAGRSDEQLEYIEQYLKLSGLFRNFNNPDEDPTFSEVRQHDSFLLPLHFYPPQSNPIHFSTHSYTCFMFSLITCISRVSCLSDSRVRPLNCRLVSVRTKEAARQSRSQRHESRFPEMSGQQG